MNLLKGKRLYFIIELSTIVFSLTAFLAVIISPLGKSSACIYRQLKCRLTKLQY